MQRGGENHIPTFPSHHGYADLPAECVERGRIRQASGGSAGRLLPCGLQVGQSLRRSRSPHGTTAISSTTRECNSPAQPTCGCPFPRMPLAPRVAQLNPLSLHGGFGILTRTVLSQAPGAAAAAGAGGAPPGIRGSGQVPVSDPSSRRRGSRGPRSLVAAMQLHPSAPPLQRAAVSGAAEGAGTLLSTSAKSPSSSSILHSTP